MLSLKQTLNHLVSILNGQNRQEMLRNLEKQIEEHHDEAQLYNLDDSYHERMRPVHRLQREYADLHPQGKYYPYGVYKMNRRLD